MGCGARAARREIVDAGLDALSAEELTVESLAVSLAAPRLRREGVPVPEPTFPDAEMRLYRRLEETSGELAHARHLAYLLKAIGHGGRLDRDKSPCLSEQA